MIFFGFFFKEIAKVGYFRRNLDDILWEDAIRKEYYKTVKGDKITKNLTFTLFRHRTCTFWLKSIKKESSP